MGCFCRYLINAAHSCIIGVDIVLNSLAEEKLQSSVRVLAEHGHFLEIGKFDLSQNNSLGECFDFCEYVNTV